MGLGTKAKPKKGLKKRVFSNAKRSKTFKASSCINVCHEIQKGVDSALLKLSPKLQTQIDQVMKTLEKSSFNLEDLRTLGYRILKQASQVSEHIKVSPILSETMGSLMNKKTKSKSVKKIKKVRI